MWYDNCMLTGNDYKVLISLSSLISLTQESTVRNLASWLSWPINRLNPCLDRLRKADLVIDHEGRLLITTLGDQEIQSTTDNPSLSSAKRLAEFTRKALSGELKADNVALPSYRRQRTHNAIESAVLTAVHVREIAARCGLDTEETREGLESGRIRFCRRCRRFDVHWKDSKSATGWQSYCRRCV